MEVKLWNELNDQQAEKATGGGLGNTFIADTDLRLVDGFLAAKDIVKGLGFKNLNEAARDLLDSNVGQVVSTVAQGNLFTPPTV